jgi:hypothetical protein
VGKAFLADAFAQKACGGFDRTNLEACSTRNRSNGGVKDGLEGVKEGNHLDIILASDWPCFSASFCLSTFFLWLIFFLALTNF